MKSKTKVKTQTRSKTNFELADTITTALKNKAWMPVAAILSSSTRKQCAINLSEIDSKSKAGDTIVIPGKILSLGELTKKVRICALSISKPAAAKLKASKSEFIQLIDEIKKNPKSEGVKIIQ